jgi:hypothetical protein
LDGLRVNPCIKDPRFEAVIGSRELLLKKGQEVVIRELGEGGRLRKIPQGSDGRI